MFKLAKVVLILGALLIIYWLLKPNSVTHDDIYVNKLVYLKKNNKLFTGILLTKGDISYAEKQFCNGLPCGSWFEKDNYGGIIQKGTILKRSILSYRTRQILGTDTIVVDYWQEGESPAIKYPQFVSITILRSPAFFKNDSTEIAAHFPDIEKSIVKDLNLIKYDELSIAFVDAFFSPNRQYIKYYDFKNGTLFKKKR